jgi:hypothetical protein
VKVIAGSELKRKAIADLRMKYFGTTEQVGDVASSDLRRAEDDIVILDADIAEIKKKLQRQVRESKQEVLAANQAIARLRERLQRIHEIAHPTLGNGEAVGSATAGSFVPEENDSGNQLVLFER